MDMVDIFLYGGDAIELLRLREKLAALEASKESLTWEKERLQNELYFAKRELAIRTVLCESIMRSIRDNQVSAIDWDPFRKRFKRFSLGRPTKIRIAFRFSPAQWEIADGSA